MHQNPPHRPPQRTAPTEPLPARASRTSFYLTVGCLSVIAGLVLGVGGFFGVRALQDDAGASIAEGDSDGGGEDGAGGDDGVEATPPVFEEIPAGPADAVPFGSTFPVHSTTLGAEVEVSATAMDWDATPEILEANSLNLEPEEGSKYVMLTIEGVYRGERDHAADSQMWIRAIYVAEDGTEHRRSFVVTPYFDEVVEQAGVAAGGTFLSVLDFQVPEEIESGGHVVLLDDLQGPEEGVWMEAS